MAASSQELQQRNFIFIPLSAPGHMIPMIDMACLFASRGVISTIITTRFNAARFKPVIDRAIGLGLSIRLIEFPFPCQETGLPERYENVDTLDSIETVRKFFMTLAKLQNPIEQFLRHYQPRPSCIISDSCLPWTCDIACNLQIPRIVFHGMCSFAILCSLNIAHYKPHEGVSSESDLFVLPGLSNTILITKAQLPEEWVCNSEIKEMFDKFREADSQSYGVVFNSFEELELEYIHKYRKATGKKVWAIGPVSLCNREIQDKAQRGNKAAVSEKQCLNWLDSKEPNSTVYCCFGSLSRLNHSQLIEIGLGLEASNRPFVWVIRNDVGMAQIEKWLLEGFEERVQGRGLVIRGWAPQTLILSHPATAGFLTHCGWNSTLEGICAGVPLITCPLFAEQFVNEKLVVNVFRVGISIGNESIFKWCEEGKQAAATKEAVKKAIEKLMDEDEEGEERRMRAREVGESARKAMEEGGSSYNNMTNFIQDMIKQARKSKCQKMLYRFHFQS